jgi:DNA repair exonuclease SbcCD ATPase subunit
VESGIEGLSKRWDAFRDEVEAIDSEVEALETRHTRRFSLHKDANQLEYELGQLETDRKRVEENTTSIEDCLADEADLKIRCEDLTEIETLRTPIKRIAQDAIEEYHCVFPVKK